jgi:hypothetical protein
MPNLSAQIDLTLVVNKENARCFANLAGCKDYLFPLREHKSCPRQQWLNT